MLELAADPMAGPNTVLEPDNSRITRWGFSYRTAPLDQLENYPCRGQSSLTQNWVLHQLSGDTR
jgi:hypothetical protein